MGGGWVGGGGGGGGGWVGAEMRTGIRMRLGFHGSPCTEKDFFLTVKTVISMLPFFWQ